MATALLPGFTPVQNLLTLKGHGGEFESSSKPLALKVGARLETYRPPAKVSCDRTTDSSTYRTAMGESLKILDSTDLDLDGFVRGVKTLLDSKASASTSKQTKLIKAVADVGRAVLAKTLTASELAANAIRKSNCSKGKIVGEVKTKLVDTEFQPKNIQELKAVLLLLVLAEHLAPVDAKSAFSDRYSSDFTRDVFALRQKLQNSSDKLRQSDLDASFSTEEVESHLMPEGLDVEGKNLFALSLLLYDVQRMTGKDIPLQGQSGVQKVAVQRFQESILYTPSVLRVAFSEYFESEKVSLGNSREIIFLESVTDV